MQSVAGGMDGLKSRQTRQVASRPNPPLDKPWQVGLCEAIIDICQSTPTSLRSYPHTPVSLSFSYFLVHRLDRLFPIHIVIVCSSSERDA